MIVLLVVSAIACILLAAGVSRDPDAGFVLMVCPTLLLAAVVLMYAALSAAMGLQ